MMVLKDQDPKSTEKSRHHNYNSSTRYVGFRCPNEIFEKVLKGKNKTEIIISLLEILAQFGTLEQYCLHQNLIPQEQYSQEGGVKQNQDLIPIKKEDLKILLNGIQELNYLMMLFDREPPSEVDPNKIIKGVETCQKLINLI